MIQLCFKLLWVLHLQNDIDAIKVLVPLRCCSCRLDCASSHSEYCISEMTFTLKWTTFFAFMSFCVSIQVNSGVFWIFMGIASAKRDPFHLSVCSFVLSLLSVRLCFKILRVFNSKTTSIPLKCLFVSHLDGVFVVCLSYFKWVLHRLNAVVFFWVFESEQWS